MVQVLKQIRNQAVQQIDPEAQLRNYESILF